MLYMTTAKGTQYDLRVQIVEHVDNEGEPCDHCQLYGNVVQAQAYVVTDNRTLARQMIETCLACLIPAIDSTPYVEATFSIAVEVARSATRRPF